MKMITSFMFLLCLKLGYATLLDHGPFDPTLTFPQWYRDTHGVPLGLCRSTAFSTTVQGATMCFPLTPSTTAFAGNVGPEVFYMNAQYKYKPGSANGLNFYYLAGLEASYLPGPEPVKGQEWVFSRIRIAINFNNPALSGDYTITHPYGVETFRNVQATSTNVLQGSQAAVYYTNDVPLGAGDFEGALNGQVGPFLSWDTGLITVGSEKFIGDPNVPHTFTGSPYGTNFIRVSGPQGVQICSLGEPFCVEVDATTTALHITELQVMGQVWTAPIPTKFKVQRATISTETLGTDTYNYIDVWATSAPKTQLLLSGVGIDSMIMHETVVGGINKGVYHSHIRMTTAAPRSVYVTETSANPAVITEEVSLADIVSALATYNTDTRTIIISAMSSVSTAKLVADIGLSAPVDVTNGYTGILPTSAEPPIEVIVTSSMGGIVRIGVKVNGISDYTGFTGTITVPTTTTVSQFTSTTLGSLPTNAIIILQPNQGTITKSGTNFQFTPKANAVLGTDSFEYVLYDVASNTVSSLITYPLNIIQGSTPPVASPDQYGSTVKVVKVLNVLSNDKPGSTNLNDAIAKTSVKIVSAPPATSAQITVNPDGTINFTGLIAGTYSFTYTVSNSNPTNPAVSTPTKVDVTVFTVAESITYTKNTYVTGKWTITFSTNYFGPALTNQVGSCYLTQNNGVTLAAPGTLIVSGLPMDATGKFSSPNVATPVPTGTSQITCKTSNGASRVIAVAFK